MLWPTNECQRSGELVRDSDVRARPLIVGPGTVGFVLVLASCGGPRSAATGATHPTTSLTPATIALPASTTSVPTTITPIGTSVPHCRDDQIVVSDNGGGAGLGHEDQVLLFTNTSDVPCTLAGYPGVAGLDASGQQAVQAIRTPSGYLGGLWDGATTLPQVVLTPREAASAVVEGTDNPIGTATSCPRYDRLLVTPPNLTISMQVRVSGLSDSPANGLPGCTPIEVHPVVPGTHGTEPS
ncbi:MAG: DUF4232 domain-containing protein [Acidimicrobiales bacterium]